MRRELLPFHDISDMTMSVMRQKQDEACRERLTRYPSISVFDEKATDSDVFSLLRNAFPFYLNFFNTTLAQLRKNVLKRVQMEAKYLSVGEQSLLEAMLDQDGEVFLEDWDDLSSAESLIRRLWCTVSKEGDDLVLKLPWELQEPIATVFSQKKTKMIRSKLLHLNSIIEALQYRMGFVQAREIIPIITDRIAMERTAKAEQAATRFLMASFEYEIDASGELLLLHPGLSSAGIIIQNRLDMQIDPVGVIDTNSLFTEMSGFYPQEVPLIEGMIGALIGALRPEYDPAGAAQDLHMLIKQGASMDDLRKLLCSMLAVLPTSYIMERLRLLYEGTPRWAAHETPVVN